MTTHTQGEARVCTLEIADGDCVVMIGERQILECYEDGEVQTDEDRANAQRVVKTWNAYQKLVDELRKLALQCQQSEERFAPTGNDALALLRDLGEPT